MFGYPESAKKMKEKGAEKKRETGELKASPKFYYEVIDCHLLQTKAYICSEKGKLQNNMKQHNYSEVRKEKNQKQSRLDQKQEQTIFAMHSDFRYHSKKFRHSENSNFRYDSEFSL